MVGNAEFIVDRFLAESWKVLRKPFRTIYREIGGDNPRYRQLSGDSAGQDPM